VVVAVDLVEVDVVRAEAAQRVVDLGHDRFARQAAAVGSQPHRMAQLGGDHHGVAVGEVLERAAEDLLAGAVGVHVRGVEEVDPRLHRVPDERSRVLFALRPDRVPAVGFAVGHRADRDRGNVEAGRAELDVLHDAP
jgi:hypothetical protein